MQVMSAESPRKQSREKSVGKVILPQVVEDKSLIDSFTGFIQDVVPQVMKQSILLFYVGNWFKAVCVFC